MRKRTAVIGAACFLCLAAVAAVLLLLRRGEPERETVVIAIPHNGFIRNIDTNYYKLWLEEQSGLSLEFVYVPDDYPADYLGRLLSGGAGVDALFSWDSGENYAATLSLLGEYGAKGYILPLNGYLDGSTNLEQSFDEFTGYDLRDAVTADDGNIYFMPGLDASESRSVGNVLWINQRWLKELRLTIPGTTEEMRDVLAAFKTRDPNGNGIADEIPLAGSRETYGHQSYNAIINAFVYNDPQGSRLFVEGGAVKFAPVTDEWREAMKYLNGLYRDGLLDPLQFTINERSLSQMALNPDELLGAFTSDSITDVLLQNTPEILANYVHVAPLAGPGGVRNATAKTPTPQIGGIITSACENPGAVFKLFDLMLSEEAFLIGRFGEQGVDWAPARAMDTDYYGNKATVLVLNPLVNKMQNKHLCDTGPFFAYPQYADGVTVATYEADAAYMNARAYREYRTQMPSEYIRYLRFPGQDAVDLEALRQRIDAYTGQSIQDFITGVKDPLDDAAWEAHKSAYQDMDINALLHAAQSAYEQN